METGKLTSNVNVKKIKDNHDVITLEYFNKHSTGPQMGSGKSVTKEISHTIGTLTYDVAHNLGYTDVIVQVYRKDNVTQSTMVVPEEIIVKNKNELRLQFPLGFKTGTLKVIVYANDPLVDTNVVSYNLADYTMTNILTTQLASKVAVGTPRDTIVAGAESTEVNGVYPLNFAGANGGESYQVFKKTGNATSNINMGKPVNMEAGDTLTIVAKVPSTVALYQWFSNVSGKQNNTEVVTVAAAAGYYMYTITKIKEYVKDLLTVEDFILTKATAVNFIDGSLSEVTPA